jgi:hypothetical protein
MKTTLLAAGLLAISAPAFGQGTILFANVGTGLNAPIFDADGTTRLAGTGFSVELLAGATAASILRRSDWGRLFLFGQ